MFPVLHALLPHRVEVKCLVMNRNFNLGTFVFLQHLHMIKCRAVHTYAVHIMDLVIWTIHRVWFLRILSNSKVGHVNSERVNVTVKN